MNSIKITLVVLFFTMNAFALGGAVGNGGGFAYCSNNQKWYAYDYLITLNHQMGRDIPVSDLSKSIQYIAFHLQRLNEPLLKEFVEFFAIIYTRVPGKKFQWVQQKDLRLMYEPDLETLLPLQCRSRKQAVYFFPPFSGVTYSSYKYDPDLFTLVQSQPEGPLQVSYTWVHEWLWNHFSREQFLDLARFNRLLHSEKLSSISPAEYSKYRPQLPVKPLRIR